MFYYFLIVPTQGSGDDWYACLIDCCFWNAEETKLFAASSVGLSR